MNVDANVDEEQGEAVKGEDESRIVCCTRVKGEEGVRSLARVQGRSEWLG